MRDRNSFYLFTSISPRLSRSDLEYQRACIASWRSAGFEVATVNGDSEIDRISNLDLDVQILRAARDGKPLVFDILASIFAKNCRFAGIINADCAILPYPGLLAHLKEFLDGKLVYAERLDVDDGLVPRSDSCSGFDGFFFDTAVIPSDFDNSFRIGIPWWDYWLPMAVSAEGGQIGPLMTPLLTHRVHDNGWTATEWASVGQEFFRILKEWRFSKPESFPALGKEVDELWMEETLTLEQLRVVGAACFQWLTARRLESSLRVLPPPMEPIEAVLRAMRGELKIGAEVREELIYRQEEVLVLTAKVEELTANILNLNKDKSYLRQQLAEMERSTSWRVAKPLRQLGELWRRRNGTRK
jgi:hypothetical protein